MILERDNSLPRHECSAKTEDKFIIYKCTQCDHKRKVNRENGDMEVIEQGEFFAMHIGVFDEYKISEISLN